MGSDCAWTQTEDQLLLSFVARYGTRWRVIAQSWPYNAGGIRRCHANRLRKRYQCLTRPSTARGSETLRDTHRAATLPSQRSALPPPSSTVNDGCPSLPSANEPSLSVLGPTSPPLAAAMSHYAAQIPPTNWYSAVQLRLRSRDLSIPEAAFVPRPSHVGLIDALRIGAGYGATTVVCDLEAARRRAARLHPSPQRRLHVEASHATMLSTQATLPTLTGARYRSLWIGGRGPGAQRYFSGSDAAAALGLITTPAFSIAAKSLSEPRLWRATTDSLALSMATAAVCASIDTVPVHHRPSTWRCGSLFCGVYDALFIAAQRAGVAAIATLAVEKAQWKLDVAWRAHRYLHVRRDAFAPADDDLPNLDMLFWTPPCPCVSSGGQMSTVPTHVKRARALSATRRAAVVLVDYARRTTPILIVGEQVKGLLSHYPAAWLALGYALASIPYAWRWTLAQASQLGHQTLRARLIIMGTRVDYVYVSVARALDDSANGQTRVGGRWTCRHCHRPFAGAGFVVAAWKGARTCTCLA